MSLNPRLTLIGLNNYDSHIFDGLRLPAPIEKDLFIDVLLMKYGECPLLYPSLEYMRGAIAVWSDKWYDSFVRMLSAITADYNPVHNFDRMEEYTDTETTGGVVTTNSETDSNGASGDTTENKVSAFNSDTYQPNNESTANGTTENHTEDTTSSTSDTNRNLEHTAHLYGNIGLTTSQQMIISEIDMRYKYNPYDLLTDIFKEEFCLYIY